MGRVLEEEEEVVVVVVVEGRATTRVRRRHIVGINAVLCRHVRTRNIKALPTSIGCTEVPAAGVRGLDVVWFASAWA